ncbi:hypothetical protein PQS90_09040 [Pseudomonas sp. BLCC-B13]|uniref:hypothetical protein n=1 Tax=Pseudomonas sp. BLCC-B13 TaxID=3025314 RepID=UPI00234F838E|nr:hypothetical protein [Pseudomonas sp. BLCC-B13]MDC7825294.1 hypothetical protein [Pseudomonas sp. BLCC-B13]
MAGKLAIRDEDTALEAIKRFLEGEKLTADLELEGWPKLRVRLVGDKFDSTITPTVMKSFIELQNLVYQSYALAQYGTDDTRKLSKAEREELEIEVKVEEGSSIFEVDFQEVLMKFAEKAAEQMTPEMIAVTVLGLGVLWAGKTSYAAYLDHRKEVRLAEVNTEAQRAVLDGIEKLSKQETERMRVINQMVIKNPTLEAVSRQAYDTRTEMLRGFASADTAEVGGREIPADVASELITNARRKAVENRLDGYYRILRVDSSNPDEFKVKVRKNRATLEFEAVVEDAFLNAEMKEVLQYAEWERTTVYLNINAKLMDEKIKSAVILGVARADQPDEAPQ